jgi:hypothetical protein
MITFGIFFCWALCQVDFVMAYPQALIETDIYMELPQGIQTAHENSENNLFKLEKNLRPEIGQMHLELVPCGKAHVRRIHTVPSR